MHCSKTFIAAVLAFAATNVLAAPIPQLAGEGSACNSVLSDTDNGVGYGTENAEDNVAGDISSAGTATKFLRRQLAGEGAACDSILTDTDSGVGYGTENAEDNVAGDISSAKLFKRQADKIAAGAQKVSQAAGTGDLTSPTTTGVEGVDGTSTSGAAAAGAEVGSTEEGTLEAAGSSVPKLLKRQADKIAAGAQKVSQAAGTGDLTSPTTTGVEGLDGTSTSGAAAAGAEVGSTEEGTLEAAGSSVP